MSIELVARVGQIAGYIVRIDRDDSITVLHEGGQPVASHTAPCYGTHLWTLAQRPGFRLGWVRMEDDAEIIYLYDRNDDQFGYALNLTDPRSSEWGYAPFFRHDEGLAA